MQSPQTEDGFTKIANELLEAFTRLDASGSAWRVFMVVLRKTYGYHKKVDKISLTQFEAMSGLSRKSVCRGLNELMELNIITVKREGYINMYSVQKNYPLWGSVKPVTSDKNDTKSSVKPVTKTSDKNDTYKRKKEKKDISDKSQKDMSAWKSYDENKHMEENAIDLDSREEIKPEKRKKKVTDEMQAVFNLFSNPAKAIWGLREVERNAAQALYDTYGLETLERRVKFVEDPENRKDHFFPLVSTPSQLLDKTPNVDKYLV